MKTCRKDLYESPYYESPYKLSSPYSKIETEGEEPQYSTVTSSKIVLLFLLLVPIFISYTVLHFIGNILIRLTTFLERLGQKIINKMEKVL